MQSSWNDEGALIHQKLYRNTRACVCVCVYVCVSRGGVWGSINEGKEFKIFLDSYPPMMNILSELLFWLIICPKLEGKIMSRSIFIKVGILTFHNYTYPHFFKELYMLYLTTISQV